ncbi:MAG: hypothetical protein LBD12_06815, partial [Clostridiales Family XIII bacterium]|nr:hypothetical protein [Clostridiales Family XIII bacterium]
MKKTKGRVLLTILLSIVMLATFLPSTASAAGTEPPLMDGIYQIDSADELAWFAEQVNIGNTDIDCILTGDVNLSGTVWTPIGTPANEFAGIFNGDGKTVSNLSITGTGKSQQGFFANIGSDGLVKNLSLSNLTISLAGTSNYVGGIAANSKGRIVNCTVGGSIAAAQRVGGIVASAKPGSVVAYCTNNAALSSSASSAYIGGIAGEFCGRIEYCANTGSISVTANNASLTVSGAGGIAGAKYSSGATEHTIDNCYNAGNVSVPTPMLNTGYRGGLLGVGAAGSATVPLAIRNSFNVGAVTPTDTGNMRGAIAPGFTAYASLENLHFLEGSCDKALGAYAGGDADVTPHTAVAFADGTVLAALPAATWQQGASFPVLKPFIDDGRYDPGYTPDPEPLGDYTITDEDGLFDAAAEINADAAANNRSYEGTITLVADIDLGGESWIPIQRFAGMFDGAGHTVSELTIQRPDYDPNVSATNYGGIFEVLEQGATVQNVVLSDVFIQAGNTAYVGAVAGINRGGMIEKVVVTGEIYARSNVGGIVGVHEGGTLSQCGSTADIEAANPWGSNAGGIAGTIGKTSGVGTGTAEATDVYALGSVSGQNSYVGGLFGQIRGDGGSGVAVSVANGYSLGEIHSTYENGLYGAIAGSAVNASVSNIYYSGAGDGIYQASGGTLSVAAKMRGEFADGTVLALLNAGAAEPTWKQGAASPILGFEADQPPAQYTVSLTADEYGTAVQSGDGTYAVGATVTLTATLKNDFSHYVFVGWHDADDLLVSSSAEYSFEIFGNAALHAKFTPNTDPAQSWYDPALPEYTLKTADQLIYFAQLVNTGVDFAGKTVKLGPFDAATSEEEIDYGLVGSVFDLRGKEWQGIGTAAGKPFAGTFIGKSAKGGTFPITLPDASSVGLFGTLAPSGTVMLTTVKGDIENASGHVGGIVAHNNGEVNTCVFEGSILRHFAGDGDIGYVGGVVGYNYGASVTNCLNRGNVTFAGGGNENTAVGGVVGYSVGGTALVEKCENSGTVKGWQSVGGIVGKLVSSKGTLEVAADPDDYAKYTAGIRESKNTGNVIGRGDVGGIAGLSFDSAVSACQNAGPGTVVSDPGASGIVSRLGGIVGY